CYPTTRATSPATRSSWTAAPRSRRPSGIPGDAMTTWCRLAVDGTPVYGFVEGDCVTLVTGSPFESWTPTRIHCGPNDFTPLVPVVPGNFYAAGLNYRARIEWWAGRHGTPANAPAQADVGYRSVNALVASDERIVIPKDSPGPVEYEGELVA